MKRVLLVSAILPIVIKKSNEGFIIKKSPGGLIRAIEQVSKFMDVSWIGWHGYSKLTSQIKDIINNESQKEKINMIPVELNKDEIINFFHGFSNITLWPLFHEFVDYALFEEKYWKFYKKVNKKFAQKIVENCNNFDFIWVHDYQFLLLPKYIKKIKKDKKIGFFLHIPFPNPELFIRLPWRESLLKGLLDYDILGFQSYNDLENFINCLKLFFEDITINYEKDFYKIVYKENVTKAKIFPISIDYQKYEKAKDLEITKKIANNLLDIYKGKKIVFCADRLDFTKGLLEKIKSYETFLEKYPQFIGKIVFIEAVSKNIKKAKVYKELEEKFFKECERVNEKFSKNSYKPIVVLDKRLDFNTLVAYYNVADICYVSSIKDGMNLVSKEFIASKEKDSFGALILSEFTGAAQELYKDAYLINPFDYDRNSDIIYKILNENKDLIKEKLNSLQNHIKKFDIKWWSESYIRFVDGQTLKDSPSLLKKIPLHERL
ncbi:alpha,alpha-trehalose-phosphate synthase (UDP-forming) [Nitrosophilus kaiyonis]|uniref:alpha,alpha-trehalose-phosphate synthase (UDP-forming) n=1 Tax=Nitrosophilus kaiyonis TaxID=2930200 RepID=UPI0024913FD5|nr:trehalose-6-phosphate synthase [Nitrosophilus kaiyonis]